MNSGDCLRRISRQWLNLVFAAGAVAVGVWIVKSGWALRGLSSDPVPAKPVPNIDVRCGPYSLRIASLRLGVPVALKAVQEIPVHPVLGASIGDLKVAATRLGLTATSTRTTVDALRKHPGTAILFVDQNHFVAVDPREVPDSTGEDRVLRVYDPGKLATWWSRAELRAAWNGEVLLLTRDAGSAASPGSDSVAWEYCWMDLGLVDDPESATFEFPFTNRGLTTLEVSIDGTSCSCTSAKVSPTRLLPGESGTVSAAVNLLRQPGYFAESVRVKTGGSGAPLTELVLCGSSLNSVVSARSLHFGSIYAGDEAVKYLLIQDRGDKRLKVTSAEWLSQVSSTVIPDVAATVKISPVRQGDDWNERLPPGFRAAEQDHVIQITIRAAKDSMDGKFAGQVDIATNLPAPWTRFPVLVEGLVASPISAKPAALTMSDTVDDTVAQLVTLTHKQGHSIDIIQATVKGELPLSVEVVQNSGPRVIVKVQCEPRAATKTMTGIVVCELDSRRTIEIPVIFVPAKQSP